VLVLETIQGAEVFTESDISFVQTLADLIGLAIDRARLQANADSAHQANEAERTRLEMMATLSHELRMPLTSIKGYATPSCSRRCTGTPPSRPVFLRKIDEECINMEVMIRDMLDSSLIGVDHLSIDPEPVRLEHIVRDVTGETQRRVSDHQLVEEFRPEFPIVMGDMRWIKQVFRNIWTTPSSTRPTAG